MDFAMRLRQRNRYRRGAFIDSNGHHAGDTGTVCALKHFFEIAGKCPVIEVTMAVEDIHVCSIFRL
jgi:hypothetical protein